jgi:hypothetical protein
MIRGAPPQLEALLLVLGGGWWATHFTTAKKRRRVAAIGVLSIWINSGWNITKDRAQHVAAPYVVNDCGSVWGRRD